MEEIAETAGFSKGALYAHFKSKEELFLALAKAKAADYQAKLRRALERAPTRETKIAAFRRFYVDLSRERRWALIILEVKLFVTRNPEVKQRLWHAEQELGEVWRGRLLNSLAVLQGQPGKRWEESSRRWCLKLTWRRMCCLTAR